MNLTYNVWESDGVQVLHPIPFPLGYLSRDDVYVYVGDWGDYQNQLSYQWIDDNNIELDEPVPAGTEVVFRRVVDRSDLKYYFQRTPILGPYLDNEHLQLLMIMQEIEDGFLSVDGDFAFTGDLDMRGYKIFNLQDADVNFGDHAVNMKVLREFVEAQAVGGGSVISATPPPSTVTATRWWRCTDGKAFIRVTNSTGYGQWVEERAPINPPNYEINRLEVSDETVDVGGEYHNYLITLRADTSLVQVDVPENNGVYTPGAMVFIHFAGDSSGSLVAKPGVTIESATTLTFADTDSVCALIALSETSWLLVGDMLREV